MKTERRALGRPPYPPSSMTKIKFIVHTRDIPTSYYRPPSLSAYFLQGDDSDSRYVRLGTLCVRLLWNHRPGSRLCLPLYQHFPGYCWPAYLLQHGQLRSITFRGAHEVNGNIACDSQASPLLDHDVALGGTCRQPLVRCRIAWILERQGYSSVLRGV
ncbi:hypothetical protein MPH_13919 [Macrophomina phaseolina MS6]|uniref:Uncharacterized protein n=1 Tax=Macrophomina phaseolina (strain MS6) TaxID=1126212 RepID=K2QH77_MACPH|nr:hypothetical protein MPH_13919 [Macrophomina phaseolina MS6]